MSGPANPTLADLLPPEIDGLGEQLKAHVDAHKGAIPWPLVQSQALDGLKSELGKFDLFAELGKAWASVREIRALRDPAAQPAGAVSVLPLSRHQVVMGATPTLHLSIGGVALPPLSLGYSATAALESVHLSIRDGQLVAAAPGHCAFNVVLTFEGIPLHAPKELGKIKLPGEIRFEPGWKIP